MVTGYGLLFPLLFVFVLLALGLGIYALRFRHVPGARAFAWAMFFFAGWVLVAAIEVLSPALADKILWHKTRAIFIQAGWLAILIFAVDFTGHTAWTNRRRVLALLVVPTIVAAASLTSDWNGWFRYNLRLSSGPVPSITSDYGPLFLFHYVYLSVLLVAALGLLVRSLPHAHPWYRRQVQIILAGLALPLAVDLLDLFGIEPIPGFTLTPVICIFSGLFFAYALFRYRLFDLTPIARSVIVEKMADLMLVLDEQGRLVDMNPAAATALAVAKDRVLGRRLDVLPDPWRRALGRYQGIIAAQDEISVAGYTFDLMLAPVTDHGGWPGGTLIVLHEVTQRKEFQAALHRLNAQLEGQVAQRTAELEATLADLRHAFAEHKQTETARRQSEERYRLLFETMVQGVIYYDAGGHVLSANPAAERILGLSLEQIRTLSLQGAAWPLVDEYGRDLPPDEHPALIALRTAAPVRDRIVGVFHPPSSSYRWLNANAIPFFQQGATQLDGVYSTFQDITATKQMEEILAQRVADQSGKLAALYGVILVAGQSLSMQETLEQSLDKILLAVTGQAAAIHQQVDGRLRLVAQQGLTPEQRRQIDAWPSDWLADEANVYIAGHVRASSAPPFVRVTGFDAYLGAPIRLQNQFVGGLSVYWTGARVFSVEDIAMFRAIGEQLSVIVENVRLRERIALTAVVNERRRLARDLHDSVTQSLHSLVLTADNVRTLAARGRWEAMDRALVLLSEAARQSLKEMRLLLYELRLKGTDQIDLAEQLQLRLDTVELKAGIAARLAAEHVEQIPRAWIEDLYAISMEALNNSLKHARATQVIVSLHGRARGVALSVSDNGIGFDTAHPSPGGMGLKSMSERAERLGGALTVVAAPGQGTCIQLAVEGEP